MPLKVAITTSSFTDSLEPLNVIHQNGVAICRNALGRTLKDQELLELLDGCVGVIAGTEQYSDRILGQLKNLKVISRCGAGIDNIHLPTADQLGIKVFNTPNAPTRAVAELVIGLSLDLLRQISWMDRRVRQGAWDKKMGRLFQGKNLGIIGFGRIGQEVAKLAVLLGAHVYYFDSVESRIRTQNIEPLSLSDLLAQSDIVSIHVPYSTATSMMIGHQELNMMKSGSVLINCSRGGIVDEQALMNVMQQKKISGAALDVFEQEPYRGPLAELDNVILTPHIGSYAQEARISMEIEAVNNLIQGLSDIKLISK